MTPEAILALACMVGQPARDLLPHEAQEIARIIQVESGGDPLAINVNGPGGGRLPVRSLSEATTTVERLVRRGYSVDVGLSQVNLRAHPGVFNSLTEAFDPRANVCAGARIYVAGMTRAARCTYNTGHPVCGNGYPEKVERAPTTAPTAAPKPPSPTNDDTWDVWATPAPQPEPSDDGKEATSSDGKKPRLVVELVP